MSEDPTKKRVDWSFQAKSNISEEEAELLAKKYKRSTRSKKKDPHGPYTTSEEIEARYKQLFPYNPKKNADGDDSVLKMILQLIVSEPRPRRYYRLILTTWMLGTF